MSVTVILTLATVLVAFVVLGAYLAGVPNPLGGGDFRNKDGAEDDGCAACGHAEVLELAPGAYLCPSCGYEGGPNLARVKWVAEMATLKERPAEQQLEARRSALEEGHLLVSLVEDELQRASDYRDEAASIRPITKEARAHINELNELADAAVASTISPTLEAISQLETVEFLDTGGSNLEPLRAALVDASNVHLERAAIEQALQQLKRVLLPT